MAYYFRRRRYSYRRRPRRYVRRWFKRRFRRYINGSTKSIVRLRVPLTINGSATQAANADTTEFKSVCPWLPDNSSSSVLNSGLYQTYCQLYEEVKCVGMKVVVSVTSAVGGSDIPSLQFLSGVDRKYGVSYNSNDNTFSYEPVPSVADFKTYSSYTLQSALNNNVAKFVRSVYASDLMEKAIWHDSSLQFTDSAHQTGTLYDEAVCAAGMNPSFFHPAFLFLFAVPNAGAAQKTINYTLEIMYYFAFRNPKYGGSAKKSAVNAKGAAVARSVHFDDDMDDGDVAAAVPPLPDQDQDELDALDGVDVDAAYADADKAGKAVKSTAAEMSRAHRKSMRSDPIVVRRKN